MIDLYCTRLHIIAVSATLLENLITQGADVNARDKGGVDTLTLSSKKWSRRGFTNFIGKWGKHACQGY